MTNKPETKSIYDSFFWMDEADILYWILLPLITKIVIEVGKQAAIDVGVVWSFSTQDAVIEWARNFIGEEIIKIIPTTQKMVQNKVSEWIASGEPLSALENDPQFLEVFGKVRAKRIAVTEVTNAYAGGNLESWKASGVVDGKEWRTFGNACKEICMTMEGQQVPLNEMFIDGDGNMHDRPPAHVNCKCAIYPVVNVP